MTKESKAGILLPLEHYNSFLSGAEINDSCLDACRDAIVDTIVYLNFHSALADNETQNKCRELLRMLASLPHYLNELKEEYLSAQNLKDGKEVVAC